jgi:hypothetical protein
MSTLKRKDLILLMTILKNQLLKLIFIIKVWNIQQRNKLFQYLMKIFWQSKIGDQRRSGSIGSKLCIINS